MRLPRRSIPILLLLLAPAGGRAQEVIDRLFRLQSVSGAVDGGVCKPGATFRVQSEWQNVSGNFVRNVEARRAVLTGNNSLKSTHLLVPSRGSVAPQESVFGTFLIQLASCASFQFYVNLLGSADSGELLWVNEFGQPASQVMDPGTAGSVGFTNGPGEPGGPGGFGGPPAGSGFSVLSGPVRIGNLRVSDEGSTVRGTITLDLISNVSSWRSTELLTETSPGADVFANSTDTLAIQILRYSRHLPGIANTVRIHVASIAFGYRSTLELIETGIGTNRFASDHYQVVVTTPSLPTPSTVDTLTLVRLSNRDQTLATGVVLTETGADSLQFRNGAILLSLTRLTSKGSTGADDFTAEVTVNGAAPFTIDAMETTPASLEFRTDAIQNQGAPGDFPGATRALAIGEKWRPVLYIPQAAAADPPAIASVTLLSTGSWAVQGNLSWSEPKQEALKIVVNGKEVMQQYLRFDLLHKQKPAEFRLEGLPHVKFAQGRFVVNQTPIAVGVMNGDRLRATGFTQAGKQYKAELIVLPVTQWSLRDSMSLDIYSPVGKLKNNPPDPNLKAQADIEVEFTVEITGAAFATLEISDLSTTGFTPNALRLRSVASAGFAETNDAAGRFFLWGNDNVASNIVTRIKITAVLPKGSFIGDGGVRFRLDATKKTTP